MEATTISKTADKKMGSGTADAQGQQMPDFASNLGAGAGMPLFLQRSSLAVGPPDDPYEQEAEHVSEQIMRGENFTTPKSQLSSPRHIQRCACGGMADKEGECAACRAKRLAIQRKTETGGGMKAPSSVLPTGGGQPLPMSLRSRFEPRFGQNFGSVRLHTDTQAAIQARAVQARAFTAGSDIVFGAGQYAPETAAGQRLLAHELTHVVQQRGARWWIQRQPVAASAAADAATLSAGPCAVVESDLSNVGLLFQLNRARVYLAQTTRGEGEWYDFRNLLRRLSTERRRRIGGGHVWLAESGLLQVPEELYTFEPGMGLRVTVRRVAASAVSGTFTTSQTTVMTRRQFERFLDSQHIPVIDGSRLFADLDASRSGATTFNLPAHPRQRPVTSGAGFDAFGRPTNSGFFTPSSVGSNLLWPAPFAGAGNSLDLNPAPFSTNGSGAVADPFGLFPFSQTVTYTPGAGELLRDVRNAPGLITSSGPERIFLPPSNARAPSATGGAGTAPFLLPPDQTDGAIGLGGLGAFARPDLGLANGATGVMWEGSHVVDLAVLNDRMFTRGFRAPFSIHATDSITSHRSRATAQLNVGTPGSYANDAIFGYGGEVWGSPSHWRNGTVIIVRQDGTPLQAAEMIELMVRRSPSMQGQEYRFSPPRAGSAAFDAADREAQRRGLPHFCPAGGHNCINVPIDLHQQALGGVPLTYTRPDGTVVNLAEPANASAANMSEFMNQPDSFFEQRGLRRVRVGPAMWRGVGMGAGAGATLSLFGDAGRALQGENVSLGQAAAHAGIGGGSSAVSMIAEDIAYTSMTSRLVGMGMSGGAASTVGRLGASTGVAFITAPLTTGLEMWFSDEHYTSIDYAARMGRSGVAGAGGALATVGLYTVGGSAVPGPGTAAGFLIGLGVATIGYFATDALLGTETEDLIRESLGEGGCTSGIGPGR